MLRGRLGPELRAPHRVPQPLRPIPRSPTHRQVALAAPYFATVNISTFQVHVVGESQALCSDLRVAPATRALLTRSNQTSPQGPNVRLICSSGVLRETRVIISATACTRAPRRFAALCGTLAAFPCPPHPRPPPPHTSVCRWPRVQRVRLHRRLHGCVAGEVVRERQATCLRGPCFVAFRASICVGAKSSRIGGARVVRTSARHRGRYSI